MKYLLILFIATIALADDPKFHYGDYVKINKPPSSFFVDCWGIVGSYNNKLKTYHIVTPDCNHYTVYEFWDISEKDLSLSVRPQQMP